MIIQKCNGGRVIKLSDDRKECDAEMPNIRKTSTQPYSVKWQSVQLFGLQGDAVLICPVLTCCPSGKAVGCIVISWWGYNTTTLKPHNLLPQPVRTSSSEMLCPVQEYNFGPRYNDVRDNGRRRGLFRGNNGEVEEKNHVVLGSSF